MLPLVEVKKRQLKEYRDLVPGCLLKEIDSLSRELRGKKVFHVNSTPKGGGVAEILKSLVPLMRDVGLDAEWYTAPFDGDFFEITKRMHNALQGKDCPITSNEKKKYMEQVGLVAELMKEMKPDIWVIHDPQPAGVVDFLPNLHPSIFRLHIDLTSPNPETWNFISSFASRYDKVIVSSSDFIKKEIKEKAIVAQPAIDAFSSKNRKISPKRARETLKIFGIDPGRPFIAQVSRFDPWKDPLGVVRAYRIAKKEIPDLQLALVGFLMARDDPEAERVYGEVAKEVGNDPDIFLFTDLAKLGSLSVDSFVGCVQTAADVVLQKSTREGFGMTVAEAMWKEKPVIGGNVGGIRFQIEDEKNGFLVSSSEEAAGRILQLIKSPELRQKMGREAKKTIRDKFLMPRLLRDYLRAFKELEKSAD